MSQPNYQVFSMLLEKNNVRTADVCRATGIDPATFSNWKKGNYAPKNDKLELIAKFFNIAPWDFYLSPEDMEDTMKHPTGYALFEAAAGQGRINDGLPMEESVESEREDFGFVKIVGDSMYPDLQDGDVLKTIPYDGEDISPTDYCVVKVDGEALTVKHIEMTDNGVWLRAVNKEAFEDVFYSTKEVMTIPILIVGKAISIAYREL